VLPILKEKLFAKGAVVNCDETWCRVKVNRKYGKKYIWSMVKKEAIERKRSSSAGMLPTGRKNMLPMSIGIKE